jgi:hypothetical protein
MAQRAGTLKILCPMCRKENEYAPAAGCLIKCRHCSEWFGEPALRQSRLIPCPGCAQEIHPTAANCPFCGHPLPATPAGRSPRLVPAARLLAGVLFAAFALWLVLAVWRRL